MDTVRRVRVLCVAQPLSLQMDFWTAYAKMRRAKEPFSIVRYVLLMLAWALRLAGQGIEVQESRECV